MSFSDFSGYRLFLVVIHPNIAILDQWLPIIVELKKSNPNYKFIGVFYKDTEASKVNNNDILNDIANELLDGVITFPFKNGIYFSFKYQNAISRQHIANKLFQQLIFKSKTKRILSRIFLLISTYFYKFLFKKFKINISELEFYSSVILTDSSYLSNEKLKKIINFFSVSHIFCLPHGSGVGESKLSNLIHKDILNLSLKVFSSSDSNKLKLAKNYKLNPNIILNKGLPKYSDSWINYILHFHSKNFLPENFIYVTSRPSSHYFTFEEKFKILTDIINISKNLKCSIIIRPHPKEDTEEIPNIMKKILGKSNLDWFFDPLTAIATAKKALFAVHMSNTMPSDTALVGTPSLTYRSINSRHHYPFNIKNSEGINLSPPENEGYSFPCFNEVQFKNIVVEITSNRKEIGLKQKTFFEAHNKILRNSAKMISDIIKKDIN